MPDLAAFQADFAAALGGDDDRLARWLAEGFGAGLSVYRNTTRKGAVDAVVANFPTVERLVGEEWLRAAASLYATEAPPVRPALVGYGQAFPDWLSGFSPAADMPYLAEIARIDRLWLESHQAADAEPLSPDALSGLSGEALASTGLELHPSVRLADFGSNAPSLWLASRPGSPDLDDFAYGPAREALLLVRPCGAVEAHLLSAGAITLIQDLRSGASLAGAAQSAMAIEPDLCLADVLQLCLREGAFARLTAVTEPRP